MREHAATGSPDLSVVIAAWNGPVALRDCLASLERLTPRGRTEVLVARWAGDRCGPVVAAHPLVIDVALDEPAPVPTLRKAGLDRASGAVVAFLEDHATVTPGWAEALRAAYARRDRQAVGGPVDQGPDQRPLDWGAYLFDYGRYMPPQPPHVTRELSGLNMSFRRTLLDSLDGTVADGVFEAAIATELARRGIPSFVEPRAIVIHRKRYAVRTALRGMFHLGRGYAGRRIRGMPRAAGLLRAAACPLLPALLVSRVLLAVLPKRQHVRRVLSASGFVALIACSWSAGECVGYLIGSGDSDARWR
jgi:GT2 family glycosyltransferase